MKQLPLPPKLSEDNFLGSGVNMLRDKINEILDYLEELPKTSVSVSIAADATQDFEKFKNTVEASFNEPRPIVKPIISPDVPRRLKGGNWMLHGRMMTKAARKEMGLK